MATSSSFSSLIAVILILSGLFPFIAGMAKGSLIKTDILSFCPLCLTDGTWDFWKAGLFCCLYVASQLHTSLKKIIS